MVLLLAFLATPAAAAPKPKNIIFLIGDGMGPAHVTAMQYARREKFQLGRIRTIGLVATHCANAAVTDSAASATAYAIGLKTNHEALSVDVSGKPHPTVLELAEKAGKATGLVTTTDFWDATPAAFAAHAAHRDEDATILDQMMRSGAEIIIGGGAGSLGRNNLPSIDDLATKGNYAIVRTRAELDTVKGARVLGVFTTQPRDTEFPEAPLPMLAKWAIDRLSGDPDGFFLVIENEGIDSASHRNFGPEVRASLESFDAAVGVALDFAAARDDTLVLVTGDHETGGLRVSETRVQRQWRMEFSTVEHTAVRIPIFAFGPGAESFAGMIDNTDVGKTLLSFQSPLTPVTSPRKRGEGEGEGSK